MHAYLRERWAIRFTGRRLRPSALERPWEISSPLFVALTSRSLENRKAFQRRFILNRETTVPLSPSAFLSLANFRIPRIQTSLACSGFITWVLAARFVRVIYACVKHASNLPRRAQWRTALVNRERDRERERERERRERTREAAIDQVHREKERKRRRERVRDW